MLRRTQHLSAGGLSLLVHGLFLALLFFGVTWRSQPHLLAEAELWRALPPLAEPLPALSPASEPLPRVQEPEPAVESPDIALARAEKIKAARLAEETRQKEAARQKEEARLAEIARLTEEARRREAARQELVRQEEARRQAEAQARAAEAERQRQAQALQRRQVEQELARQAESELAAEEASLQRQREVLDANASRQARELSEAQDRIRTRIRSYLRVPPNLAGNPEAMFRVTLLPNGEVLQAVLLRSSGQASYDREVERAILKASPLPLPKDRAAAAAFRDGLVLKFRPREEAAAGR